MFQDVGWLKDECDAQTAAYIAFDLQGFAYRPGVFVVWLI